MRSIALIERLAMEGVIALLVCTVLAAACDSDGAKPIRAKPEAGWATEAGVGISDTGGDDGGSMDGSGMVLDANVENLDSAGTLGRMCPTEGALACNGAAQKLKLICQGGEWAMNGVCAAGENCYQPDGTCHPIVPGCEHQPGGFTFCERQDVVRTCDADGVVAGSLKCEGICESGKCLPPRCGDAKVEADEECDDGNTTLLDGCEPRICKRSRVLSMALGGAHTCVLTVGGYVRCWGNNLYGQLGLGHEAFEADRQPYQLTDAQGNPAGAIDLGGEAIAIGAGASFTCALLVDKTIRCWGGNGYGQLGLGHAGPIVGRTPRELDPISIGGKAIGLGVGGSIACAILEDGGLRCWGSNNYGELGLGHTVEVSKSQTPNQFGPISLGGRVLAIAAAGPCALLSGGTVRCWGGNLYGRLGLGHTMTIGDDELPSDDSKGAGIVPMPPDRYVRAVSVGGSHACALLDNGSLECWGKDLFGQLGLGSTLAIGDDESPAERGMVDCGGSVSSVVAGYSHTCALGPTIGLRCWGRNKSAEIGTADIVNRGTSPATVPSQLAPIGFGAARSVQTVFASGNHTCVVLSDAQVYCWGSNASGQLGLGYISSNWVQVGSVIDYVGGDVDHTPDKLPSINVFPPQ